MAKFERLNSRIILIRQMYTLLRQRVESKSKKAARKKKESQKYRKLQRVQEFQNVRVREAKEKRKKKKRKCPPPAGPLIPPKNAGYNAHAGSSRGHDASKIGAITTAEPARDIFA